MDQITVLKEEVEDLFGEKGQLTERMEIIECIAMSNIWEVLETHVKLLFDEQSTLKKMK